jgi:hypothetical protein
MLLELAREFALSLGHHFLYATLDGSAVAYEELKIGSIYGLEDGLSGQQFSLAVGILFAFWL